MNVQKAFIVLHEFAVGGMGDFTVQNISSEIVQNVLNQQNEQVSLLDC
jgi:hypothetical protein